jgi:exosome complex RNA-binding protein Rrp4
VREQTDEICRIAVAQNGYALQHAKEQTDEICKLAVAQNGCALQFVKEQTEGICEIAVAQNGSALQYVKEQTDISVTSTPRIWHVLVARKRTKRMFKSFHRRKNSQTRTGDQER